ncbi:MAG: DedA family protein [Chlamydiota bacterium]
MDTLLNLITAYSAYAPWAIFALLLLAGCNIPVSIDLLMVTSAVLAATTIPEATASLYLSMLFGCYFSAWIAYWIGRKIVPKLCQAKWFSKILSEQRATRIQIFYQKHSWLTLILGRFIPFGIRNGIFMTVGMSKMPFSRFIVRDGISCFFWTTICFTTYYYLGLNYQTLSARVKMINLGIFLAFSVTVIVYLWYKKYKKSRKGLSK